jgi:hypothetical protein
VQDYFHPPVIDFVTMVSYAGRRGETIGIRVTDSVAVARVRVVIRDSRGRILERGWVRDPECGKRIFYIARKNLRSGRVVQIEVTATDHAGNTAALTVAHELAGRTGGGQVPAKNRGCGRQGKWCPEI